MTPSLSASDLARFLAKVERRDADVCWPWLAGRSSSGYGLFRVSTTRTAPATHVAVLVDRNEWPAAGQIVLHRCDNPPCCNPSHLLIGTRYENAVDMIDKGRCGTNVLSAADVAEIRGRLVAGERGAALARAYGVSRSTVSRIGSGKVWKHTTIITTPPADVTANRCDLSTARQFTTVHTGGAK